MIPADIYNLAKIWSTDHESSLRDKNFTAMVTCHWLWMSLNTLNRKWPNFLRQAPDKTHAKVATRVWTARWATSGNFLIRSSE